MFAAAIGVPGVHRDAATDPLLPAAGVSLLGAAGTGGGGGGVVAANLGGGVVLGANAPLGLRAGVTWHRLQESEGALWLLQFGIVRGRPRPR